MSDTEKPEEEKSEAEENGETENDSQISSGSVKRTSAEVEPTPVSLWLITFTDVMALMLTFFVLLYSMSVPEEEKWEDVVSALNRGLSVLKTAQWNQGKLDTIDIEKLEFANALDLNYLSALVKEIIDNDESLKGVVLIPENDRLVISLPESLLFEAGQTEVTVEGKKAMFALAGPLSRIRNRIEVTGHTDPAPAKQKGSQLPSNWALSLARAADVAGVLENVGYGRPVTVRGLSSTRYEELPSDISRAERLDLSRRIDIIIMKDDGRQKLFMQ